MSYQATAWASEVRVGDPTLKSLLMAIAHRADRVTWACWPSMEGLAYDTEVSKRTIQRRLLELVEKGLISIETRRRPDGTQANSLITITGGQIVTLSPPQAKIDATGGQKQGVPVDTAVTLNKQEEQEEQIPPASRGRKGKAFVYSEEFEEKVWMPYPRKTGTSKWAAFQKYEKLTEADRALLIVSIPAYCILKKGKDQEHIHHLEFYISKRIFENCSVSAPATANPDWLSTATRVQWAKILKIWRGDQNWRLSWGPAPGKPGCHVPTDMLFPGES